MNYHTFLMFSDENLRNIASYIIVYGEYQSLIVHLEMI